MSKIPDKEKNNQAEKPFVPVFDESDGSDSEEYEFSQVEQLMANLFKHEKDSEVQEKDVFLKMVKQSKPSELMISWRELIDSEFNKGKQKDVCLLRHWVKTMVLCLNMLYDELTNKEKRLYVYYCRSAVDSRNSSK
jgi:hypothetical protein